MKRKKNNNKKIGIARYNRRGYTSFPNADQCLGDEEMIFKKLFQRQRNPESEDREMKLVVGLGNPGQKYEGTRHNVGFQVIDHCEKSLNIPLNQSKFKGLYGFDHVNSEKIFLLKPLTFMNLSGESVVPLMKFYKMSVENLLVIYDDLDLKPGAIRLRQKGSHGGHNGMRSIISHLGTEEFNRIRIGIGRPEPGRSVSDYVLGSFHPSERELVNEAILKASEAVEAWTSTPFLKVMNDFNS